MTRRLRFIQWNINGFSTLRGQGDLLASLPWDVAALQEVTTGAWPQLRGLADDAEAAVRRLPPLAGDPPRYHAALLVRRPFELRDAAVLRDVPSPERTLVGTVTVEEVAITVASLAVPPGVSWGDAGKGRQAARYAAWLRDRTRPTVVGMDANSPKWDRWTLPTPSSGTTARPRCTASSARTTCATYGATISTAIRTRQRACVASGPRAP